MARYDQVFASMVQRAVEQGLSDVRALVARLVSAGLSDEAILEALTGDVERDGPIFGRFVRGMRAAASATTMAAMRQGEVVGAAVGDTQIRTILREAQAMDRALDALESGDPEAAAEVQELIAGEAWFMWVAELRNTCHYCIALHAKTATLAEWQSYGLDPDTIHPIYLGPNAADCHCRMVAVSAPDTKQIIETTAPLKRVPLSKGEKRTARRLDQQSIDNAWNEARKAQATPEGMAVLRKLGQALADRPGASVAKAPT